MYTRTDIVNALIPILEEEYTRDNALAARELDPARTTCVRPLYYGNGERVIGAIDPERPVGSNPHFDKSGFHRDHFAGREYVVSLASNLPDMDHERVFGTIGSDRRLGFQHSEGLPDGIRLACRIWGALGFERGTNNLGHNSYFALPTLCAEGTYIRPPAELGWLPRQFQSEQRLDKLARFCPKAAAYLRRMLLSTKDPFLGHEDVLAKVSRNEDLTDAEFAVFIRAASDSIKKRPWKIPLEDGPNMTQDAWDAAVAELDEALKEMQAMAQRGADEPGASAAEYAKWTLFNGLRVNHWAFLTGNLDDTLLCNIIDGEKVVARAGRVDGADEFLLTSFRDPQTGIELGGLFQAGIAAPVTYEIFTAPKGRSNYYVQIEGPFVEYIERVLVQKSGEWKEINEAFLPANALKVFKSTMPNTRESGTWADKMTAQLNEDPLALFHVCLERGWMLSAARLLDKHRVTLSLNDVEAVRAKYHGTQRTDVDELMAKHLGHAQSMPMRA
ncbi:MAG: hypothetical protein WAU08_15250 [Flavobacteriales bacterium]